LVQQSACSVQSAPRAPQLALHKKEFSPGSKSQRDDDTVWQHWLPKAQFFLF
jgi:hypothetical protein